MRSRRSYRNNNSSRTPRPKRSREETLERNAAWLAAKPLLPAYVGRDKIVLGAQAEQAKYGDTFWPTGTQLPKVVKAVLGTKWIEVNAPSLLPKLTPAELAEWAELRPSLCGLQTEDYALQKLRARCRQDDTYAPTRHELKRIRIAVASGSAEPEKPQRQKEPDR